MSSLSARMTVNPMKKAWILVLLVEKFIILVKYLDYMHKILKKSAKVLTKQTRINKYGIKLKKSKSSFYWSI